MAFLDGFTYRKKITIDSTKIDSNLTDFPVLVKLDNTNFDFNHAKSDGSDIRFTLDDSSTLLKYERENHDSVGEEAFYWVKIPSILSAFDVDIYMYYGDAEASDGEDAENVWDSNYKGVWHLKEEGDGTLGEYKDSTSNNNDGQGGAGDSGKTPNQVDSIIYKGQDFERDNTDFISIPDALSLELEDKDFYLSLRTKIESFNDPYPNFISKWNGNTEFSWLFYPTATTLVFTYSINGTSTVTKSVSWSPSLATEYKISIRRQGADFKFYVDDIQQGATQNLGTDFLFGTSQPVRIGEYFQSGSPATNGRFDGIIDELEIVIGESKSDAWVKASYNSENDNLLTFGNEEQGIPEENIEETITLDDTWNIFTNPDLQNIEEIISLNDDWSILTNPIQEQIEETITLDDDWLVLTNPEIQNIEETVTIDDDWNISTIEYSNFASKIISYNPLIYVANSNPAKIVKVDITDPENPIKYIYEIISNSYAKDVIFNSTNDYFYVVCANGKVVKINKNDLEDQTEIDTLDTDVLQSVDSLDASLMSYVSTDDSNGEIILLDEREVKKINTDLRIAQQIITKINTQLNLILGKIINTDLRLRKIYSKIINTDLRILAHSYEDINKYPISYTDWEVYINGTELTVLDDIDMNSILITHDITQEENKASQAQFILNRRHDKLDYTNTDVYNQITNNNEVIIIIKGITEFTGKISNLTANSETETVNVIVIGTRHSDKRHQVSIPIPSVNEQLNLYHCIVNNVSIDNPYINPDDENPEYYKGIQIDLGTKIKQNILRYSSFLNSSTLAEEIENGDFNPKQNWTYFWFARFTHFVLGLTRATSNYIGTSLGSLSADAWKIDGCFYKYQKELEDTETELGLYQIGETPYNEISVKNGKKITKDKWVDKNDGLYKVKDEGYDYTEYAKRVADLEYQKLLNINGQILPVSNTVISLSVDAYYYYNIGLLTRINITNTTTSNIYNNNNGFPVAVKNIRIQCSTEGENSMIVELTCDNQKSQLELEEIDEQYPDENSDEFIFEAEEKKQYKKFDPNAWGYID